MLFAQSIECRDKFLRLVFFGTKMTDEVFSDTISSGTKETFALTMTTASQARKAFR